MEGRFSGLREELWEKNQRANHQPTRRWMDEPELRTARLVRLEYLGGRAGLRKFPYRGPLSPWQEIQLCEGRHGAGGAESSTSCSTDSSRRLYTTLDVA